MRSDVRDARDGATIRVGAAVWSKKEMTPLPSAPGPSAHAADWAHPSRGAERAQTFGERMATLSITGPYIPRADGALRDWLENFAKVARRRRGQLDLSAAEIEAIGEASARFASAYASAIAPGERCRASVARKNELRHDAWRLVRPIAMRLKHADSVPDSAKIELGIYPPRTGQSRIRAPRRAPSLELVSLRPGVHQLRYRDASAPTRFAKPYGAVALLLQIAVGPQAARSFREAKRAQTITRHVFDVHHPATHAGQTATYFASWITRRGERSPTSKPLSITIV